jgi:hypothetical protein
VSTCWASTGPAGRWAIAAAGATIATIVAAAASASAVFGRIL